MRFALLATLFLLTSSLALADVAGETDLPEDCTLENHERGGITCDTCVDGSDIAASDENHCATKFEGTNLAHVCNTAEGNEDERTEVWCGSKRMPDEEVQCGGCSSIDPAQTWPLFLLLGGIIYAHGRRARNHA